MAPLGLSIWLYWKTQWIGISLLGQVTHFGTSRSFMMKRMSFKRMISHCFPWFSLPYLHLIGFINFIAVLLSKTTCFFVKCLCWLIFPVMAFEYSFICMPSIQDSIFLVTVWFYFCFLVFKNYFTEILYRI